MEAYAKSLKVCLNHIPYVQGGLTGRPGTKFVDPVKDSTKATRLKVFKFSSVQAYCIEIGDQYFRFKRDNGAITETAQDITDITQANPAVLTYTGADPTNGDEVDLRNITGMPEANDRRYIISNVNAGANTFELTGVDSSAFTAYGSGGTFAIIYEIASPYLEADLFEIKFTQSADVLYLFHPSYETQKLSRTAHNAWTLTAVDPQDGPYLPFNLTATTLDPSATSGTVTVLASSVVGINNGLGFLSGDVGRLIRIKYTLWHWMTITVVNSTVSVTAVIEGTLGAHTAETDWRLGLWSGTTGYPAVGTFFEDRLCFGGSPAIAGRIDMSRNGDYENFQPVNPDGTIVDDHAISVTLSSDDVQITRWIKPDEKGLVIGTVEGEWIIRPSTQGESLTPSNINAKQSTTYGSRDTGVISVGKAILFIQKSSRKIRELAYVFEVDGFRAPDLSILSEHITAPGLIEMAWQQDPQSIIWANRSDGVLSGFTYERDQKVLGWHRHQLGGDSDANGTGAAVESITVVPDITGTRDEVWMVVKRWIDGAQVRYVEYMTKVREVGDDPEDAFYVDSGATYDGAPTTTINGLYHLRGQVLSCLADGAVHPDVTPDANGKVTLTVSASKVHLGLGYNRDGQKLRIEAGAADGVSAGKAQRITKVTFRLLETGGFKCGPDFDNLDLATFRTSAHLTGTAVPLFTGDKLFNWPSGYGTEELISWRIDQPLPCTVLGVYPQLHTFDK